MATFTRTFRNPMPRNRLNNARAVLLAGLGLVLTMATAEVSAQSARDHRQADLTEGRADQPGAGVPGAAVSGPVAAVGHGALLDAAGNELHATPELILQAQRHYIDALYQHASPQQRLDFDVRAPSGRENSSILNNAYANAILIARLLRRVNL